MKHHRGMSSIDLIVILLILAGAAWGVRGVAAELGWGRTLLGLGAFFVLHGLVVAPFIWWQTRSRR